MKIYFASGNTHKREEIARILAPHTIIIPPDEGIPFDPEETADDFFGNALIKAKSLFELVGMPVIADDSGICVDALNGKPGIKSARYGSENGITLSDRDRNAFLLSNMNGITQRTCRFVCNMVLYLGPDRFYSIQETLEGLLVHEEQGSGGFGYDPLVFIEESGLTVAELSPTQKDILSHRGKAARKILLLLNM